MLREVMTPATSNLPSSHGSTIYMVHPNLLSDREQRTRGVLGMITQAIYSVQVNLTGTIQGELHNNPPFPFGTEEHAMSSVRNHIREGHVDYSVTAHSWPNFCYLDFVCDANDIEKGLWKSPLLVKVCTIKIFGCSSLMHCRHSNLSSHRLLRLPRRFLKMLTANPQPNEPRNHPLLRDPM